MDFIFNSYDGVSDLEYVLGAMPDRKRLTSRAMKAVVKNKMGYQKQLHKLDIDECKEYKENVQVFDVIEPDLLVIHFPTMETPSNQELVNKLMYGLAETWNRSPGFARLERCNPVEGMKVIAAVNASVYPEDKEILAATIKAEIEAQKEKQAENGGQMEDPNEEREFEERLGGLSLDDCRIPEVEVLYYRGVVFNVTPGFNITQAKYDVFLYDKGAFSVLQVERIIPLCNDYELSKTYVPKFRLLRIPGLRPQQMRSITTELCSRAKDTIAVPLKNWPSSTLTMAEDILLKKQFALDVFADEGIHIIGDLRFLDDGNDQQRENPDSADSTLKKSATVYSHYLLNKEVAYRDTQLFLADLALDAEDEEKDDWEEKAKTRFRS